VAGLGVPSMRGFNADGDLSPDGDPSNPDPFSYPLDYVEARPDALELVISDLALAVKVPAIPAPAVGVVGEARPDALELVISDVALGVEVPVPLSTPATPVLGWSEKARTSYRHGRAFSSFAPYGQDHDCSSEYCRQSYCRQAQTGTFSSFAPCGQEIAYCNEHYKEAQRQSFAP
jgi:hypothetical protein